MSVLDQQLMIYLKTTDTCQLNCEHCFTNGINGKKGWFDPVATSEFFHKLHKVNPYYSNGNISFHGGEPMLCPIDKMFEIWNNCKHLWPDLFWSVQTNLTYNLTDDRLKVFNEICNKSFGTSWDSNIRWETDKQQQLWKDNVKLLVDDGHEITMMVCLSTDVIKNIEPITILNMAIDLGIAHINFERITNNGNAALNPKIIPLNIDLDKWFLKMWNQSVEHKTYKYINNIFFNSILTSFVYGTHSGCRCRQCEQKIFTINANGSIGGCPNGAVDRTFGTIWDDIIDLMTSEGRMCNISEEAQRPAVCYTCPVYSNCHGDCHQLEIQDNICPAPKSLMIKLQKENDIELYKKFLNGFIGKE